MKRNRNGILTVLLCALLLTITACGQQTSPAASGTAPTTQAPATPSPAQPAETPKPAAPQPAATPAKAPPFKFEAAYIGKSVANIARWIANEKGFFKDENLEVTLTSFSKPTEAFTALQTGAVHTVSAAPDPVLTNRVRGGSLIVVGAEVVESDWTLVTSKDITDLKQLKGATLGANQLASASTRMVLKMIQTLGNLGPNDVTVIEVGSTPNRLAALQNGAIKATVLSSPDDLRAAELGMNILARVKEVISMPGIVLITDEKWAKAHKDEMVRFLRAIHRAQEYFHNPANKDYVIDAIARNTGLTPALATKTYDFLINEKMLARKADFKVDSFQGLIDDLKDLGQITGTPPKPADLVDLSYNKAAMQ